MKYKWNNDLLVLTIKNEVCRLLFAASRVYFSSSGLIHTRHFCPQYCDKKRDASGDDASKKKRRI